jgi:hypothetical protein
MWGLIHKKTAAVFLGLTILVAVLAGVAYMSLMNCPGFFRRSYHTIILRDKNYVDGGRFRVHSEGALVPPNGHLAGFTILRSSDCVDVAVWAEDQGSPAQADEEIEKRIKRASKVIEQAPLIDPHGNLIGQRAILLVHEEPHIEIIAQHKNDAKLLVIRSASLAHALAYEKLILNGHTVDRDGYFVAQSKQLGGAQ